MSMRTVQLSWFGIMLWGCGTGDTGAVDTAIPGTPSPGTVDADGDGYDTDDDCDDADPSINPGVVETCDGIDNHCDDQIAEGVTVVYYADGDGDGHGDPASWTEACSQPSDHVTARDGAVHDHRCSHACIPADDGVPPCSGAASVFREADPSTLAVLDGADDDVAVKRTWCARFIGQSDLFNEFSLR